MADSADPDEKRPQFGNRFLTDPKNVFEHNAWDNVVWDEEQQTAAEEMIKKNTQTLVEDEKKEEYEKNAEQFWDKFYDIHQNRFFKDRHWLFTEFPELAPKGVPENVPQRVGLDSATDSGDQEPSAAASLNTKSEQRKTSTSDLDSLLASASITEDFPGQHATSRFLEVGCGVGNTVFPILGTNIDPGLFVYCCDLSPTAIQIVKDHTLYSTQRCHAFVCNVAEETAELPFPDGSLDIIILIFVLSAISPEKMQATINRLSALLKPGGLIVFRDYGRYDLAQLRFKDGKCLSDNFYVRGDGTRVYFFTQEELRDMFVNAGLVEEQNLIDRRLQVNRGRQLKMYRIWIQCKYRKPHPTEHTTDDR